MRSYAPQIKLLNGSKIIADVRKKRPAVVNNGQQWAIAWFRNKSKCIVLVQAMELYGNFPAILFYKVCIPWQNLYDENEME